MAALVRLRTAFILLCKLLLVDVVCSFVGEWLCHFLFTARKCPPPIISSTQDDPGIQVIICGFPRSGCTSLWQAMEILGFPCFHGVHLVKPTTAKLFMKAQASGAYQDWENLLHGYRSIVDFPATSSYKQLMELYPNAKVILNMRDPKNWYYSFSQTILRRRDDLVSQVVQPSILRCAKVSLFEKLLMNKPEDKELSITNYNLHIEKVKMHVPPHKLCVLDVEKNEGWAPLCNFLEVPIPNVPFPFANKRDSFNKTVGKHKTIHTIVLLSYLVLIFNIGIYSWKLVLSM